MRLSLLIITRQMTHALLLKTLNPFFALCVQISQTRFELNTLTNYLATVLYVVYFYYVGKHLKELSDY